MNELLNAALEYRARGWSIIPLNPGSKLPAVQWRKYQYEIASEQDVRSWWWHRPDYNIGIVTGKISNLLVIDVDNADSLACPEWDTLKVKTPRGVHYYFHPEKIIGSYASERNIDIRCQGGYVVAPPSTSSDGTEYEWVDNTQEIMEISSEEIITRAPRRSYSVG